MEQTCTQTKPLENKLLSSIQLETKPVNRSWLEDVEEHDNDCIEVSNCIIIHVRFVFVCACDWHKITFLSQWEHQPAAAASTNLRRNTQLPNLKNCNRNKTHRKVVFFVMFVGWPFGLPKHCQRWRHYQKKTKHRRSLQIFSLHLSHIIAGRAGDDWNRYSDVIAIEGNR